MIDFMQLGWTKMTNDSNLQASTMLLGRVLLVLIYFLGGFGLLKGQVPIEYAASKGVPAILVWAGFALKLFGGLAVIVGFWTRPAALGLAVFTVATAFIFHPYPDMVFLKEISMVGGLLVLAAVGPGKFSLEDKLAKPQ